MKMPEQWIADLKRPCGWEPCDQGKTYIAAIQIDVLEWVKSLHGVSNPYKTVVEEINAKIAELRGTTLKPCGWRGCGGEGKLQFSCHPPGFHHVECTKCDMRTILCSNERLAIDAWNRSLEDAKCEAKT